MFGVLNGLALILWISEKDGRSDASKRLALFYAADRN